MTHVCRATKSGNKDLVFAYIPQGLDMNYQNTVDDVTAFIRACNTENIDMVKFLIDHVDNLNVNLTNQRGYSALHYSCQYGYNEIVRLTLKQTKPIVTLYIIEKALAKINENYQPSELSSLLEKGPASLDLLQYAVARTIGQNPDSDEIFLWAFQSNCKVDTVTLLLNEGGGYKSRINTCIHSDGRTARMIAVLHHATSIVELLLAYRANPHVKDYSNCDAIECAKRSYNDGADYLRLRDPPDVVIQMIKLLTEHENHQK